MGFIDGKEGNGDRFQPSDRVIRGQALRRKIEEAEISGAGAAHPAGLLVGGRGAVEDRRGDSHLGQLLRLVLH
jgi:hypothetical protein